MERNTNEERRNNEQVEVRNINSEILECLIFKGILSDINGFKEKVFESFRDDYFDDPVASKLFNIFKSHYNEYTILPSNTETKGMICGDFTEDEVKNFMEKVEQAEISSLDNLLRQTNTYLKEKAIKNAIVRSVDYIETDIGKVFENIDSVKDICLNNGKRLNFSTIGELQALGIERKIFYLHNILFQAQIILLVGDAGMGKTIILMHLVNCLTQGKDFFDWKNATSQPVKCLYFDGEMSIYDVLERADSFSLDPDVGYYPMRYFQGNNKNEIQGDFSDPKYRKYVEDKLIENDIKVFVFDNITSLTNGLDENSTKDWSQMNQWFLRLRGLGITTIIVHHTGKDGKSQRGTSSRIANIDNEWFITRPNDWDETDEDFRAVLSFGNKIRGKRGKSFAKKEIRYSNGEWSTKLVNQDKKNGVDADSINYRALKMMIEDPNIRQTDVQSALGLPVNYKLFTKLEKDEFIDRPSNKKFVINDKGYLWVEFKRKTNLCEIKKKDDELFHGLLGENSENDTFDISQNLYN